MLRRGKFVISFILILALLISFGCGGGQGEGPGEGPGEGETPKDPIKVAMITSLTGFNSNTAEQQRDGAQDYFRYVNEEKDGIDGHPIEMLVGDCCYQIDKGLDLYHRFRGTDNITQFFVINSGLSTTLNPMLREDKCINISQQEGTGLIPMAGSYCFSTVGLYSDMAKAWVRWLSDTWEDPTRNPRLGLASIDCSCAHSIHKAIKEIAPQFNVDVVADLYYPVTAADLSTEVGLLKKAEIDSRYGVDISGTYVTFVKECYRSGLLTGDPATDPSIGDINLILMRPVIDALGEQCEYMKATSCYPTWDETDKWGVELAHQFQEKWHPQYESRSGSYWQGMAKAMIFEKVAREYVNKYGYEWPLDGEKLRQCYFTLKDYDMGGVVPNITFAEGRNWGSDECRILECRNGELRAKTDWISYPERLPEEDTLEYWMGK